MPSHSLAIFIVLSALMATQAPEALSRTAAAGVSETCEAVPGQVIVGYKGSVGDAEQRKTLREEKARRVDDLVAVDEETADMDLVKVKGDADTAIRELERTAEVKFAEQNCYVSVEKTPNDPFYSDQLWGLNNTGQAVRGVAGTPDADIDAPEAWDLSTGSNQVVVAVADTGVDYNHEDLKANMWTNLAETPGNNKDDDDNGYVDDVRGWDFSGNDNDPIDGHSHGTHVAGTIGAVGNNGIGVTGVSWNARLMPVQVLGADGRGTDASIVEGFAYAVRNGAQIVNASFGGPVFSQAKKEMIEAAGEKTLFVVAAGNKRQDVDKQPAYPCSYETDENLICVAATDQNDALAVFSNYGTKSVDIAAPGVNIYSTVPGNRYDYKSGTSMATPHVAGAAALIQAFQPGAKPRNLRETILTVIYDDVPALEGLVDKRRRLGLPKGPLPEKKKPQPTKPEPGEPTVPPNPPVDRPDLPDPELPEAPDPNLDLFTPIGGGGSIVIVIGPYTELPSLGGIDGVIGNVNRSYLKLVIASVKYQRGNTCRYLTQDPSAPWLTHSCGDELYFDLGTDALAGKLAFNLSPAQRAGLCRGNHKITLRLVTTTGASIKAGEKRIFVSKAGKRCKDKRHRRRS